jgi:hypothetical protein
MNNAVDASRGREQLLSPARRRLVCGVCDEHSNPNRLIMPGCPVELQGA